ncbi:MAG: thiamine ABC transporter substrate-binding protein [Nocardioides sp.]
MTAGIAALTLAASSCSFVGGGGEDAAPIEDGGGPVVLLTHNDFSLPDEVIAAFEEESGYLLDIRPTDGVGNLVNLVAEQAGKPSGDVVFGVDNTFASRALGAGALASYDGDLPSGVATYALPGDGGALVPVDNGNVCVNVDDTWFAERDIAPPVTLDDLTDPTYAGLFAVPSAASSSPGLAFLLATIAEYGTEWSTYWEDLVANDAEIVAGWSEAYQGEFTQGGGGGDKPIVVSYDSSPAFTTDKKRTTTATSALLETCYEQVEYAAALDGAANPAGAQALLGFLLGPDVQSALPESMYVFPVVDGTELPAEWAKFAARPEESYELDPSEIEANREDWLIEWTDIISR